MEIRENSRLHTPGGVAALRRLDPRFIITARCLIYAALGATMSLARISGDSAPFGMAFVACSGATLRGASALIGASLGYLFSGGLEWGIRYVAASVLAYTVAFVFRDLEVYKSGWFMPASSAFVMGMTAFLGSFSSMDTPALIAKLFLELTLAFGGTYFFREAMTRRVCTTEQDELRRSVSILITAGCVLMALSRPVLFSLVSAGRVLALILVMASAMRGGMLTGAAVGTVLGLAMDISSQGVPFYTMAYSFCGLLSGVFGRHGRVIFTLSFLLAGLLSVVCVWEQELHLPMLCETFCASVIFMLLPNSFLTQITLIFQGMERGSGEAGLRRFVAHRVQNLSDAYAELFEIVKTSINSKCNDENIAKIYDRAADEVCIKCRNKNRCWNAEYMDTLGAMNDATHALVENGRLAVEDLPEHFREKCEKLPAFVAAVNGELRALSYRRQLRSYLAENRNVAWGQYMDVAEILSDVAGELNSSVGSDPVAERRLLRYLKSLDIDADAAVYHDGAGRMHVTIESGRLTPLLSDEGYLEKLSGVVGARLCRPTDAPDSSSRLTLLEAEPLAVSVGIAALKKRGEKVSGDRGTYFKTDAGVLCVILADGMGCGDEAARDSARVVAILEKFLRSGVDPAISMKILNSVLLLRGSDSWGFTTVDLMCVNLFSGETCFYKYGAAPSYVISGHSIKRIKGESLAAGLSMGDGNAPDIVRMRLRPGSTAVIATDGVIVDANDEWLRELLLRGFEDMKALARTALKESERLYGANDDMTIITVRVEDRA